MSDEIIVAFIVFGGVLISVLASLYTSMRQTNSELRKIRAEIQQTYTDKLLEKRIEVYPDLYKLLSMFTKSIVSTQMVSMSTLKELQTAVSDWDANNAIFLSGKAFELSYRFRKRVAELIKDSDLEIDSLELLTDLRSKADGIKLALKEDLGIFVIEFPEDDMVFKSFQDVAEVAIETKNE